MTNSKFSIFSIDFSSMPVISVGSSLIPMSSHLKESLDKFETSLMDLVRRSGTECETLKANATRMIEEAKKLKPAEPISTTYVLMLECLVSQFLRISAIDVGSGKRGSYKYYTITCKGKCKKIRASIIAANGNPRIKIT